MKKIICLTLAIICILTIAGCAKHILPNQYTKEECYIYAVNTHDGEVTIIDDTMQMWTFIDDTFNKSVGDACTVTMHDNGTPNNIYDDVIVSVK